MIDDGLKTYVITNSKGKTVGKVSFNPCDTNMFRRYREASEELQGALRRANAIGTDDELDAFVSERIDYIFKQNISKEFFAEIKPFAKLKSGKYFVEEVMDALREKVRESIA